MCTYIEQIPTILFCGVGWLGWPWVIWYSHFSILILGTRNGVLRMEVSLFSVVVAAFFVSEGRALLDPNWPERYSCFRNMDIFYIAYPYRSHRLGHRVAILLPLPKPSAWSSGCDFSTPTEAIGLVIGLQFFYPYLSRRLGHRVAIFRLTQRRALR